MTKMACERWCVTKLCVKDGCVKGWCVTKMLHEKMECVKDGG